MLGYKKHVLHLTTVHPRNDVRIFHKMCIGLANSGFSTLLLVADGQGDSKVDDVDIVDIGYKKTRLLRMLLLPWLAYRKIKIIKPALVHIHDPELLILAYVLAKLGFVTVYDAHEDLPKQILTKDWIHPFLRKSIAAWARYLEEYVAQRLTAVVAATDIIGKRFSSIGCYTVVVNNYPDLSQFISGDNSLRGDTVCYVGRIGKTRGIVELVKALEYVPSTKLLLAGRFESLELLSEVQALPAWQRVEYVGIVDRASINKLLSSSSVGVVTLWPTESYIESSPIKLYEYMAAALPVIASSFALWRPLVEKIGVCVDPKNPENIARAIKYLLYENKQIAIALGAMGQSIALERYEWSGELEKLLRLYAACIAGECR